MLTVCYDLCYAALGFGLAGFGLGGPGTSQTNNENPFIVAQGFPVPATTRGKCSRWLACDIFNINSSPQLYCHSFHHKPLQQCEGVKESSTAAATKMSLPNRTLLLGTQNLRFHVILRLTTSEKCSRIRAAP